MLFVKRKFIGLSAITIEVTLIYESTVAKCILNIRDFPISAEKILLTEFSLVFCGSLSLFLKEYIKNQLLITKSYHQGLFWIIVFHKKAWILFLLDCYL